MRILLLGKKGQLGWELQRTLMPFGELLATDSAELNLTNLNALRLTIKDFQPDVVINAVAYTAVDQAETDIEASFAVNAAAPGVLAEACRASGAFFIHYSTDYVFDGQKGLPYTETDTPNPLNVYGKSKLAGEQVIAQSGCSHLVLRTSWVYGMRGDNFLTKTLGWAKKHPTLRIVNDQVSSPSWSRFLAQTTSSLLAFYQLSPAWLIERSGIYHLAGSGAASRFEFARTALEYAPDSPNLNCKEILPAKTADFPTPAVRPLFSVLDCSHFCKTFGLHIPPWQDSLRFAMAE